MKKLLSLTGVLILWAGVTYPLNIPLTVKDGSGVGRESEPLSSGVPIPKGVLYGTDSLRIEKDGSPVAAQFSVLSKWWDDGSIKWVLCQFQGDVSANGSSTYYLKDSGSYNPATQLVLTDGTNSITVHTGPLRFTINKKGFNLFDEAWVDGRKIISSSRENGLFVTDKAGKRYIFGTPTSVKIEESGPMRAVIKIEGETRLENGTATIFNYQVRLQAYSGKRYIRCFYTFIILDQHCPIYFDDLDVSMKTQLLLSGTRTFAIGGAGDIVYSGELTGTQTLYQTFDPANLKDSNNIRYTGTIGEGTRSSGWVDSSDAQMGLTCAVRDFWQLYPKKLTVSPEGIKIGIYPEEFDYVALYSGDTSQRENYKIRSSRAKTHELLYYFHSGDYAQAKSNEIQKGFQRPLLAATSPEWYCDSKAFGPLSPRDPTKFPFYESMVESNMKNEFVNTHISHPTIGIS